MVVKASKIHFVLQGQDHSQEEHESSKDFAERSAHTGGWSLQLVLATSPLKSLHERICRRDLSHEDFTRSVLGTSCKTCPKNSNWFQFMEIVARTKVVSCD